MNVAIIGMLICSVALAIYCPTTTAQFIYHRPSGKVLGVTSFGGNWESVQLTSTNSPHNYFRFEMKCREGYGHFGYIIHSATNYKAVRLESNDQILLFDVQAYENLFAFDEENEYIVHIDGRDIWHPKGGSTSPSDGTTIELHKDRHQGARFYYGDANGKKVDPYPEPDLFGDWEIMVAFIDPDTEFTYKETYHIGKSLTRSETVTEAWTISAAAARAKFSANAEYSYIVEHTTSETWTYEFTTETTVYVVPGETIVVWQYVFRMEQCNEEYTFKTNILGNSNSLHEKPELSSIFETDCK